MASPREIQDNHDRSEVLAAIDNGCIGAGVDIVTACDMRYCTQNAYFSVREIDMAIVALPVAATPPAFDSLHRVACR